MIDRPRISTTIMAHPARAGMVDELVGWLDGNVWATEWDRHQDRWETGRRALLNHDPDASHTLVIQDDSIPCRDLVAGIENAVPYVPPTSPMMLYVGRARPHRKLVQRAVARAETRTRVSWLVMAETYWGPALVIPTGLIPDLVAACDEMTEPNYDRRIGRWFRGQRIPVFATWPSLVEHRDGPSLVKGRTATRTAHRFVGAEVSAAGMDWSGAVITVPDPRGPVRPVGSTQKPTPGPSTRPFPARVGVSTTEERRMADRGEIIERLSDLGGIEGDETFFRVGRAVAAKWLLAGPPDLDEVGRVVGIVTDMAVAFGSSQVALAFYETFARLDETYPPVEAEQVVYEARPVRSPAAAAGRPYTFRADAIRFLMSRKGGWLTTKARGTGDPVLVERISETGLVVEAEL